MQRTFTVLIFVFLMLTGAGAWAQTGIVRGTVRDQVTNESLPGATVLVEFSTQGAAADVNGNFIMRKVPAGEQTMNISFMGYKTKKMQIRVAPGKVTVVNVLLKENAERLEDVEISAKRLKDTDISVITDIKKEDQVASGMSGDQISRSHDVDAGNILRRMGSVQLIDERFINIRGMGERYNNVMMNDVLTPSMEPDSRAFSFDVVPANVLDRVMIYKTGGPEMPAEFAGGMVKLYTKDVPDEDRLYFSITGGMRNNSTFNPSINYTGSNTDILGYDDGFRSIPQGWPAILPDENKRLPGQNGAFQFPNNWGLSVGKMVQPDFRAQLGLAENFHIGKMLFGNITSLSYSNINQLTGPRRFRYYPGVVGSHDTMYHYREGLATNDVRLGLIHNWAVVINRKNKIEFNNLFNQLGHKATLVRDGNEYGPPNSGIPFTVVKSLAYQYETRSIYSGQLQGTHNVSDNWLVKWTGGYGLTNRDEPDYRRVRIIDNGDGLGRHPDLDTNSTISPLLRASHYFSTMKEKALTGAVDIEHTLTPLKEEEQQVKLKAGFYLENKNRDFSARWFYYAPSRLHSQRAGGQGFTREYLINPGDDPSHAFTNNHFDDTVGFVVREGTRPTDHYSATNKLQAAYAGLYMPIANGKWVASVGARAESNNMTVTSVPSDQTVARAATINKTDIFPSANVTYNIDEKRMLRMSYSESINRPAFREMASFEYYDFFYNINVVGNPNLQNCYIHNFDLRYDIYPNREDIITFGAFGKYFKNPIERVFAQDSIQFTYRNAESAYSTGIEAEIRKQLSDISNNIFLKHVTLVGNASYILSRVKLGNANASGLDNNVRPLMGQAPWMINGGMYFASADGHTTFNLMYNVFGPRVYSVGDKNNPPQYELPRHVVDINVNKYISSHFEARMSLQDILNNKYQIYEDTDGNGKIDKAKDRPIAFYSRGQWFNLAFTYKIF
ncbi:MAG: TonB-dependent receptor [Bacteroidota bacterium]